MADESVDIHHRCLRAISASQEHNRSSLRAAHAPGLQCLSVPPWASPRAPQSSTECRDPDPDPTWTNYLPPSRYSRIGSSGLVTSRLRVSEPQLGESLAQHQASPPSPFAVLVSKSDPDPNPEPTLNFGENMLQALKVSEISHIGPSTFYGVVFDVLAWNCNGNAKTAKYLKELRKQRRLKVVFLCETRLKRVEKRKQGEALSEDDPGDDASPVLQFGPSTFHVVVLEVWEFGKVDDDPGDDRSSPESMQQ